MFLLLILSIYLFAEESVVFIVLTLNNLYHHRYQSRVAKSCLATVLSIQPKDSSSGGGESRENFVQRLADDIMSKLPSSYVKHEVGNICFWKFFQSKLLVKEKSKNVFMNIYRIHPLDYKVKQQMLKPGWKYFLAACPSLPVYKIRKPEFYRDLC